MTAAEEFAEFARVMFPRLRRTAFLLCGDWHTAEDLAQTALAKVFVSWRRIRRQDAAHAYTHRTLVNAYLSDRRLKRTGELLTGWFPSVRCRSGRFRMSPVKASSENCRAPRASGPPAAYGGVARRWESAYTSTSVSIKT